MNHENLPEDKAHSREELKFIINPQAKNGYCLKVGKKVELILKEENISYSAVRTEYQSHARELAKIYAEQAGGQRLYLVAVGGDGTVHEVMNGAAGHQNVTVGFIPGGSGNDFSRGFGVPKAPAESLKAILKGISSHSSVKADIGMIRHIDGKKTYFINNMGAGFDALISRKVNSSKIKGILNQLSLGKFVYAIFLVKELFTYKCSDLEIAIGEKKLQFNSAWFITISNQPFYGGGMKISPDANPFDGILNVTVVHNISRLKLLFVFASVFKGRHIGFKEVTFLQGQNVSIRSSHPIPFHADGEALGSTPISASVCPEALPVIIGTVKDG
ncbi:diacylglycerol/lipid kinase family protein [Bacillus sp. NTK034]|uniref:diacylglycerol/lipid kinase family protein n=1 Tax=Bacillus sp. NTK034 TaxID=2802176 RepID=UPI001A8FB22C|nr:diacylglycerol kinase family protein [Bacillus sp. NTK034]MBN8200900.1 diacylglycerol kinase family lipid kinase [Bacillus sp. NTK034]